ncbi:TNFAIP3-interacting protein 3 isoform X1 [Bubalus bubalis]|uniref:TNFAIP3-interacting protein 3 isoform X1 n=2 Tax=Bubalus bubalis TaxID=89462 RepID=UPI001D128109|nr:TNFAIP3-interacting protein 3 isoform X1 [Bubalus bubalis]XP_044802198.1 TNFAIP3-interacting protein 3 isoform X1 [Bubalus bubalis]
MFANQSEDSERCESMELDNKILSLIERNTSDPRGVSLGATSSHRSPCSVKPPGKTASVAHFLQSTARMSGAESSTDHAECAQSSRRKNLNSLEQKIRCLEKQRKELLEVNQQWDQQFRSMKELYERKVKRLSTHCTAGQELQVTEEQRPYLLFCNVAELKSKLDSAARFLGTLEKERLQSPRESCPPHCRTSEPLRRAEKESLNGELHELKIENNLLKEKNALMNHKKQHYECEIKRLNKALQDALKVDCSSSPEDRLGKPEMECSREEMRTEMEVLKQQVQIYEEDFKKERSDRERLKQEKEELQQIIQTSQSQLNRLNSQIKACQMEKEKLERQLKQMCFPTCNCGWNFHLRDPYLLMDLGAVQNLQKHPPDCQWHAPDQFPPDVQHKASGLPSEKKASQ